MGQQTMVEKLTRKSRRRTLKRTIFLNKVNFAKLTKAYAVGTAIVFMHGPLVTS